MYLHRRWNWHTFYTLNNANRFRNLNLNHQEPNEILKKDASKCAFSCIVISLIFVAIYTVSFEITLSILVLDYEIMKMLRNGHKFYYFLSLIHYDSACHETLYNEMTS